MISWEEKEWIHDQIELLSGRSLRYFVWEEEIDLIDRIERRRF